MGMSISKPPGISTPPPHDWILALPSPPPTTDNPPRRHLQLPTRPTTVAPQPPPRQRAKDAGVEAIAANRSERCQRHSDSKKHPLKIHPGRAQPPHFKYSPTEAIHRSGPREEHLRWLVTLAVTYWLTCSGQKKRLPRPSAAVTHVLPRHLRCEPSAPHFTAAL